MSDAVSWPPPGDAPGALRAAAAGARAALTDIAPIAIGGDDAVPFLHGQFTTDVAAMAPGDSRLAAWCSPKGRVLFLLRLLRTATGVLVLLPAAQSEAFCRRLRMYVLRAAVTIEDRSATHGVLRCDGTGELPAMDGVIECGRERDQAWLAGPKQALADYWQRLELPALDANAVALSDIRRGEPRLEQTLADTFLPQELDLDRRAGVSFEKGCYPGQEIVARVRFRGSVKRRLARFALTCEAALPAGARLVDDDGRTRGTVLFTARSDGTDCEALVVLDCDAGTVSLADAPQVAPRRLPLAGDLVD